jgi:hypothetical protein
MKTESLVRIAMLLLSVFAYAQNNASNATTFDAVVAGTKCQTNSVGWMECDYRVGKSLQFEIAGVGHEAATILFHKADLDGDYSAKVSVLHGCVIVERNIEVTAKELEKVRKAHESFVADLAFVSPHTGKVYRDWADCVDAQKKWEAAHRNK